MSSKNTLSTQETVVDLMQPKKSPQHLGQSHLTFCVAVEFQGLRHLALWNTHPHPHQALELRFPTLFRLQWQEQEEGPQMTLTLGVKHLQQRTLTQKGPFGKPVCFDVSPKLSETPTLFAQLVPSFRVWVFEPGFNAQDLLGPGPSQGLQGELAENPSFYVSHGFGSLIQDFQALGSVSWGQSFFSEGIPIFKLSKVHADIVITPLVQNLSLVQGGRLHPLEYKEKTTLSLAEIGRITLELQGLWWKFHVLTAMPSGDFTSEVVLHGHFSQIARSFKGEFGELSRFDTVTPQDAKVFRSGLGLLLAFLAIAIPGTIFLSFLQEHPRRIMKMAEVNLTQQSTHKLVSPPVPKPPEPLAVIKPKPLPRPKPRLVTPKKVPQKIPLVRPAKEVSKVVKITRPQAPQRLQAHPSPPHPRALPQAQPQKQAVRRPMPAPPHPSLPLQPSFPTPRPSRPSFSPRQQAPVLKAFHAQNPPAGSFRSALTNRPSPIQASPPAAQSSQVLSALNFLGGKSSVSSSVGSQVARSSGGASHFSSSRSGNPLSQLRGSGALRTQGSSFDGTDSIQSYSTAAKGASSGLNRKDKYFNGVQGKVALNASGGFSATGLQLSGKGSIADSAILNALQKHAAEISLCYQQALFSNPRLTGEVNMAWQLTASGQAINVHSERSEIQHPAMLRCVARIISGIRFPAPKGGAVNVEYPISFSANQRL